MGRPKGSKNLGTGTKKANSDQLIAALKFCAASVNDANPWCKLQAGYCITSNGITMHVAPINLGDTVLAVDFAQLKITAERCKQAASYTVKDTALTVKAGAFTGVARTTDPALITPPDLDRRAWDPANEPYDLSVLRDGFEAVERIPQSNASSMVAASVLMRDMTMVATDAKIIVEFYHGMTFGRQMVLPRDAIRAVLGTGLQLVNLGFSDRSITFYLEGGFAIRTQLYSEEWPNLDNLLPTAFDGMHPIPEAMWEGFDAIKAFADRDTFFFAPGELRTHINDEVASGRYTVEGLHPAPNAFNIAQLANMRGAITHWEYWLDGGKSLTFTGNGRVRGRLAARIPSAV